MIRETVGLENARAILAPTDGAPFEYNEALPDMTIDSVNSGGEPLQRPFYPMPDPTFAAVPLTVSSIRQTTGDRAISHDAHS
ncbi:MAG: hypothetical protein ACI87E_000695 [Mariniblastus sp.]|jgi:hypothetical protein